MHQHTRTRFIIFNCGQMHLLRFSDQKKLSSWCERRAPSWQDFNALKVCSAFCH